MFKLSFFLQYIDKENTDNINNNEIKPKKVYTEAQIRAARAFRERHRNFEEYKIERRENLKKAYKKDKERIIARVRKNLRRNAFEKN